MKKAGYLLLAGILVAGMAMVATAAETGMGMMKASDDMMAKGDEAMKDADTMMKDTETATKDEGDNMMMKGEAMKDEGSKMMMKADEMKDQGTKMMKAGEATAKEMATTAVAIDGYCPVCISKGVFMKGLPEHKAEYNGKTYYFASEEQRQMFIADPGQYLFRLDEKYTQLKEAAMKAEGKKVVEGIVNKDRKASPAKGGY